MHKRFRKVQDNQAAEVWVDIGVFRFAAELYENGEFADRQTGPRPANEEIQVFVTGNVFSALVHLHPDGDVRCTWSR